jgi:hypothetical protein
LSKRSRRCTPFFVAEALDQDRLNGAGRRRTQDFQARRIVGIGVVHERFFTVQFEDGGSEKDALRISKAPIQINDNSHARTSCCLVLPNKPDDQDDSDWKKVWL